MGRLIASIVFSSNCVRFNATLDGEKVFAFNAPAPAAPGLSGKGIQFKFPDVELQMSQEMVGEFGKAAIRLQSQLPEHLGALDWEQLNQPDTESPVMLFVLSNVGKWVAQFVTPADQEFSCVFFEQPRAS